MNSYKVVNENREIVRNNSYQLEDGSTVNFRHSLQEHQAVTVVTPEMIRNIVNTEAEWGSRIQKNENPGIEVVNSDSFAAEGQLVMNFANAYHPGGGYLGGHTAQEETLCAESTLYASISSEAAAEMYKANNETKRKWLTDYMLISPCVEVFRDPGLNLLKEPFTRSVITIAAPNLSYDRRMENTPQEEVDAFMLNRLHQFFDVAAYYGYRSLTLGAWGCGAFGHDGKRVARYFHWVLLDQDLAGWFDTIVFAIFSHSKTSYNLNAFREAFTE